jgi:hypothetical protein
MTKFFSLTTIVLLAFSLFVGCKTADKSKPATEEEPTSVLTQSEKQQIEKEISDLSKTFFQLAEKLNIDSCMTFFENTKDFLAANSDGTSGDFNSVKKSNGDLFGQLKSFTSNLKKESIRILSKSHVLYTIFAYQTCSLKTGDTMTLDLTLLFTKINNSWKITYLHESSLPPVVVGTKK